MAVHVVQDKARIRTLHPVFADASAEAYERFLDTRESIAQCVDSPARLIDLEHAELIAGIQAIVMSAMCFEAAIYDYAAWQLGDRYVRRHLDRLDLVAKWVVIPRLVCGAEVRKDRVPFGTFRQVIAERNRLVHSKSEKLRMGDEAQFARLQREDAALEENVHKSFRAIVLMSLEMDELLGRQFNPLPCFDRSARVPWVYSLRIDEVIRECGRMYRESLA